MKPIDNEIIYQIYPKSFQDTDGDGVGDLQGIIDRMGYIQSLGVTAIWLNPIYLSPQVDNGYDVKSYYAIDPLFGDMEKLEELIQTAHDYGLKVLFDMVLSHTSDQHRWFQEAIKGPENPYRDYYIWEDPKSDGGPPSNWGSFFGGSTWEKEPYGDQYYFHLFAKEMPDLNWENPAVRQEMIDVAKFWFEKGIDGLRLDAFIHIVKEPGFPDAPYGKPSEWVVADEYFANLPKVDEYLEEFSGAIREEYPDAYILGEAASALPERALGYTLPKGKKADSIVSFRYFPTDSLPEDSHLPEAVQSKQLNIREFKQTMSEWQRIVGSKSDLTLYWNNHDLSRMVSRFGEEENYREESSKMLATLMYLQQGTPVLLYGEEIGMKNLEWDAMNPEAMEPLEKAAENLSETGLCEDELRRRLISQDTIASRGAMQWNQQAYAGFSTAEPWSGVNEEEAYTVEDQENQPDSILSHYKELLDLKKTDLFTNGSYRMLVTSEKVYAYLRETEDEQALVVCNFQDAEETVTFEKLKEKETDTLLSNGEVTLQDGELTLSPYASIVMDIKEIREPVLMNGKEVMNGHSSIVPSSR